MSNPITFDTIDNRIREGLCVGPKPKVFSVNLEELGNRIDKIEKQLEALSSVVLNLQHYIAKDKGYTK